MKGGGAKTVSPSSEVGGKVGGAIAIFAIAKPSGSSNNASRRGIRWGTVQILSVGGQARPFISLTIEIIGSRMSRNNHLKPKQTVR